MILKRSSIGFTLVEVLIVVVIIAILAALILPRMTSQVGKAQAAEAFQMLGAIKRAAEREFSLTGSHPVPQGTGLSFLLAGPSGRNGDWSILGLKEPESKVWDFFYSSWDTGSETAYSIWASNGVDEMSYDSESKEWVCTGMFQNSGNGSPAADPCKLK